MKFNRQVKLALVAVAMIAMFAVGFGIAAFYLNRPIGFTGTVVSFNDVQVYSNSACTQNLTSFDFGATVYKNQVLTKSMWIKNTGEQDVYVAWNCTGAPTGFTFSMFSQANGDTSPDGSGEKVTAGANIQWTLTVNVGPTVALGSFSFTLNVYARA